MSSLSRQIPHLPFENWPVDWQTAWAYRGRKSGLKNESVVTARMAMAQFFGVCGVAIPTVAAVAAFEETMEHHYAPGTIVHKLRGLYDGAMLIWPEEDWVWLNEIVKVRRKKVWADNPTWSVNKRAPDYQPLGPTHCLPVSDWPERIRSKWHTLREAEHGAGTKGYRHRNRSPLNGLSGSYVDRIERGLGRYLMFAREKQENGMPNPNSVEDWILAEKMTGSAPVSIASYVYETWRAVTLIWPEETWNWLISVADELKANAIPVRPKSLPGVTTARLRKLGYDLMRIATEAPPTERNIIQYRDGLIIVLLTEKPMRMRNLAKLRLEDFAYDDDGAVVVQLGRTKNNHIDVAALSSEFGSALRFWLDDMRPRLRPAADNDSLWTGKGGQTIDGDQIARQVRIRTKKHLGVEVSPHKFRNCVAQTIAMNSPENLPVASHLLGHRSRNSIGTYAGLARSAGAAHVLGDILADYQMPPAVRPKI